MKKKEKKQFTFEPALTAFGVILILFFALIAISPGTHLYGLAYGVVYVFGSVGLYFITAFFLFLGVSIILRHKLMAQGFSRIRIFFGILIAFVGTIVFLAYIGNLDKGSPTDFRYFNEEIDLTHGNLGKNLYLSPTLFGGIIGYAISGLLVNLVGSWLIILLFFFFFLIGLVVIFFPLIRGGFSALAKSIKKSNQKKAEAKDRAAKEASLEALSKEKESSAAPVIAPEDIDNSFFEGHEGEAWSSPLDKYAFAPASSSPIPSSDRIAESRVERKMGASAGVLGYGPRETPVVAPISRTAPITPLGLQEAHFDFFDEKEKPADPTMMFAESLPPTEEPPTPVIEKPVAEEKPKEEAAPVKEEVFDFNDFAPRLGGNSEAVIETAPVAPAMPARETPYEAPIEEDIPEDYEEEAFVEEPAPSPIPPIVPTPTPAPTPVVASTPVSPKPAPAPVKEVPPEPKKEWIYPSTDLLKTYDETVDLDAINEVCARRAAAIDQKFRDLGVGAHVSGYTAGPSVTRYDIETDPNVSVNSISRYITDISQAMGGVATRFTEIVPGHTTSALEVVNEPDSRRLVPFSECFNGLPPLSPKTTMQIPFGVDIENHVISGDLSSFPHMLVAGTTGSGKSIFIQGILMSLVMRNRPDEMKLMLIDPKRVEFAKYRDIPHLLCPIIKEASEAKVALRKICEEMERRYKLFEDSAVSNIREYNTDYCEVTGATPLSYIVMVVDEYADLVEQEKDVASSVLRLSSKARACGIHMLICTQRPDTKVITGTIKNNLSTRVALHLKSVYDSSTILNEPGAEELSDHGDMIVDCDKVSRYFMRLQGCMVHNREIMAVTEFLRNQQKVEYNPYFSDFSDPEAKAAEAAAKSGGAAPTNVNLKEDSFETVYLYVRDAIMAMDATSISRIQRDFRVGYPRASEIFNKLIEDGIVAPKTDAPNSSKPCQVLVHSLEELNGGTPAQTGPGSVSSSYTEPA